MDSLFLELSSAVIAEYWKNADAHMLDEMIGARFFPAKRTQKLELEWIKGVNGLPIAIQPSAYDADPSLRDRIGFNSIRTEIPFFREAIKLGEKERREYIAAKAQGNDFVDEILTHIYDDAAQLVSGAEVQAERMRWALMQDAAFTITANEDTGRTVEYAYDYDDSDDTWATNNKTTLTSTDTWTVANAATSNPLEDIDSVIATAANNGVIISEILMNSSTLAGMLASASIMKAINPVGATNMFATKEMKKTYAEDMLGVKITVYDKQFVDESGTQSKFLKDGYVVLVPAGKLGNTYFGTTPAEYDKMAGISKADLTVVGSGIAVITETKDVPTTTTVTVAAEMLPSFEAIESVYVIKAA